MQIQYILVPQGAEHQAVLRGLKRILKRPPSSPQLRLALPVVIPLPIGCESVKRSLQALKPQLQAPARLMLVGLGGSLVPSLTIGDIAVMHSILATWLPAQQQPMMCDRLLVEELQACLGTAVHPVVGLTSDRLISTAADKQQLAERYLAAVVDMEAYGLLDYAGALGLRCAVVRVISDDCHHNLPQSNGAIASDGTLRPLPLAWSFMRHPIAAQRLIRGSLRGLSVLEELTAQLLSASATSEYC